MDKIFDLTSDKHLQIICIKNLDLDGMCDRFIWHCVVNINFVNCGTVKRSLSNTETPNLYGKTKI